MRTSRWLILSYTLIILVGLSFALPNLLTPSQRAALPDWLPSRPVTLGLDLSGGSQLVLEVDAAALVHETLQSLATEARATLGDAGIGTASISVDDDGALLHLADPAQRPAAEAALAPLLRAGGKVTAVLARDGTGVLRLTLSDSARAERLNAALTQSLEIVRTRIDQIGVAEPSVQRVGDDRIMVQLPGVQDPARIRTLLGSTAKLGFHMLADQPAAGARPAPGTLLLPMQDGGDGAPRRLAVQARPALDGDRLADAHAGFDPRSGEPVVNFRFDEAGARRFAEITTQNVGRPFAIVLDGRILSAPVIREPITGGAGQISGRFSVAEAGVLSALLRAGALPAPLKVIEERSVGPDLGGDAIRAGIVAGLAGFALVCGFMVALYRGWGMIANLALLLNVGLTLGALSALGATLTLPGIAGIILGLGLAVDANVLINERIREETRRGRNARAALDAGFRRAYATIVDSNVTSLIATLLLFQFGSGPVRGFAVTMALGILISMFTAVTVVRIVMTWILDRRGALRSSTARLEIEPLIRLMPPGETRIRFMRARFAGIAVSAVLSLASIGLFISPGLNYGVDFKGGIQVETSTQADLGLLRDRLGGLGLGEVALQQTGDGGTVLVRVERQPGGDAAQTAAVETLKAAIQGIDPAAGIERVDVVGAKVSGELATAGVLAVVLAGLAMMIYIWWRFEWPFAVGAIATLVLDVTKTVGFFALTGIDFNLTAIAALLTLIGYSVNDKVVVYDRMRENLRLHRNLSLREMIDLSINQTLGRSLYTSATAFLAMLPLAIWGGSAVESFAVPMVFGILVAASSSVFIAAPILLFLGEPMRRRSRSAMMADGPEPATTG